MRLLGQKGPSATIMTIIITKTVAYWYCLKMILMIHVWRNLLIFFISPLQSSVFETGCFHPNIEKLKGKILQEKFLEISFLFNENFYTLWKLFRMLHLTLSKSETLYCNWSIFIELLGLSYLVSPPVLNASWDSSLSCSIHYFKLFMAHLRKPIFSANLDYFLQLGAPFRRWFSFILMLFSSFCFDCTFRIQKNF